MQAQERAATSKPEQGYGQLIDRPSGRGVLNEVCYSSLIPLHYLQEDQVQGWGSIKSWKLTSCRCLLQTGVEHGITSRPDAPAGSLAYKIQRLKLFLVKPAGGERQSENILSLALAGLVCSHEKRNKERRYNPEASCCPAVISLLAFYAI